MSGSLAEDLLLSLSPTKLLEDLEVPPYHWQGVALDPRYKRVLVLAARQSGKSTIAAGDGHHAAKMVSNSLSIIVSPSEQQSKETMKKVDELISKDGEIDLLANSTFEKRYANGSRILALPGTERSVRGYSGPKVIILDEASRIEDATYKAVRPMLTGNPDAKLIAVTTPFGRMGWFYDEWTRSNRWKKIMVKPAFRLNEEKNQVIPDIPEEDFRFQMEQLGIEAYYSPRHTFEFLEEELETMDWWWWEQEYGCQFLEEGFSPFDMGAVRESFGEANEMWRNNDDLEEDTEVFDFLR